MTTQNFLPVTSLSTGEVLGIIPTNIANQTFTGVETTYTVSGVVMPLKKVTKNLSVNHVGSTAEIVWRVTEGLSWQPTNYNNSFRVQSSFFYMSISVTDSSIRNYSYQNLPNFIKLDKYIVTPSWIQTNSVATNNIKKSSAGVIDFIHNGSSITNLVVSAPVSPTATAGSIGWRMTSDFIGAPVCTFTDINWVQLLGVNFGDVVPASIVVIPPTRGTITSFVRAYVVQDPVSYGSGVLYNTIRFIKVSALDPVAGQYDYTCVITAVNGTTTTVTLSLVVQ
jgi:hypothetical protein